jgi:hypothetical protein
MVLCIVEAGAYFICACLPETRPLFFRIYKRAGFETFISNTFSSGKDSKSDPKTVNAVPLGSIDSRDRTKTPTEKDIQVDEIGQLHSVSSERSYEVEMRSITSREDTKPFEAV